MLHRSGLAVLPCLLVILGLLAPPPGAAPAWAQQAPGAPAVKRLAGPGRVDTAVAVSRAAFPGGAGTAVLAGAGTFPDALAAAPLAAALHAPLLLTGARTPAVVLEELRRLGAHEVVIVGAVGAVPLVVQAELRRAGLEVRRIAGETRFDTAALIAREVVARRDPAAGPLEQVVIASGTTAADALAAAPLAAAQGVPIVLVAPDVLPGDTAEVLAELGVQRTLLVGGTAAVSEAVAAELPQPVRVAGDSRYETAVAVARLALERGASPATVVLATGRDFPDALAAGPLTARAGGLLLLVDGDAAAGTGAAGELLAERAGQVTDLLVLGGEAAIGEAVVQQLFALAHAPPEREPPPEPQPAPEPESATAGEAGP